MADTSKKSDGSASSGWGDFFKSLPLDELKNNLTDYASAWGEKTIKGLGDKASGLFDGLGSSDSPVGKAAQKGAEKLAEGDSPVKAGLSGAATGVKEQVKDAFAGGGSSKSSNRGAKKVTNIVETIEVGVPISVAYNQWTQFEDWSDFMKKVENVEQESEEKINIKGQVFWSHRTWDSTIIQQVADEQIVWRSTGQKGHLDGAVTFHRLGPRLTRILVVVEYYPQGFMEKTGNIWRAVGRRVQVELKRYVRQIMTSTILDPDAVEGWRGEIRDSEVVRTHEEVVEEEQAQAQQGEDNENATEQETPADADDDTSSDAEDATEDTDDVTDSDETADYEEDEYVEDEPVEDFAEDDEVDDEEYLEEEPPDEEFVEDEELEDDEVYEEEPVAEDDELVDEMEEEPAEDELVEDDEIEADDAPAEDEEVFEDEEPVEEVEDDQPAEDEPSDEAVAEDKKDEDTAADSDTEEEASDEQDDSEEDSKTEPAKKTESKSTASKSSSTSKRSTASGGSKRSTSGSRSKNAKTSGGTKSSSSKSNSGNRKSTAKSGSKTSNQSNSSSKNTRSNRSTSKGKTQKNS